jgi:TrmH family RNA methyltransferase
MERRIADASNARVSTGSSDRKALLDLIASLRRGSERNRTGLFFVEGLKMVSEALSSGAAVEAIVVVPDMCLENGIDPSLLAGNAGLVVEVSRRRYENAARHFVSKQDPQGIGALVRQSWTAIERYVPSRDEIAVVLCSVQDAGNVGTILRTADAVGCSAVFVLGETADPYGPVAVRASLGSVFTSRLVRCDIRNLRRWADRVGATVIGTSPRATCTYRQAQYTRPFVLMLGNESKGLADDELESCHQVIGIPMVGRRDSLNVAVAGAVILYEAFSQCGTP